MKNMPLILAMLMLRKVNYRMENDSREWNTTDWQFAALPAYSRPAMDKAADLARKHVSGGSVRVYAIATDKRGNILGQAGNMYTKSSPKQKRWAILAKQPEREFLHAEIATMLRAIKTGKEISKLYVARVDASGNIKDGKPCSVCSLMLATEFPHVEIIWSREK